MSLHIDVRNVTGVLLADGWHEVSTGSLQFDAYEYANTTSEEYSNAEHEPILWGGGGTGFQFVDRDGSLVAGPMSAILATRRSNPDGLKEASVPEWCGECDSRSSRFITTGEERRVLAPCPRCHPDPEALRARVAARQAELNQLLNLS
ncbi:hypothetical protein [Streptomyces diastaticus]|uniref:hypothetical protein n=2 Tax=Streptomyces TaxID=1883 RepID=UPI00367875D1